MVTSRKAQEKQVKIKRNLPHKVITVTLFKSMVHWLSYASFAVVKVMQLTMFRASFTHLM